MNLKRIWKEQSPTFTDLVILRTFGYLPSSYNYDLEKGEFIFDRTYIEGRMSPGVFSELCEKEVLRSLSKPYRLEENVIPREAVPQHQQIIL